MCQRPAPDLSGHGQRRSRQSPEWFWSWRGGKYPAIASSWWHKWQTWSHFLPYRQPCVKSSTRRMQSKPWIGWSGKPRQHAAAFPSTMRNQADLSRDPQLWKDWQDSQGMDCGQKPVRYCFPRTVQQMTRFNSMGRDTYTEFRIFPTKSSFTVPKYPFGTIIKVSTESEQFLKIPPFGF